MIKTGKILGYLRTSTDGQEINNKRLAILKYAKKKNLIINDFIESQISSRKNLDDKKINELINRLENEDCLIATKLLRIGRST